MNSSTLISHSLQGQHFGYSAADMEDLGASEYTLVTIVVDKSGSVSGFRNELENCIKEVVKACKFSPRSDYLMIRIVLFDDDLKELHGFKQLIDCNVDDYNGCVSPSGTTLLFETARNAIVATNDYAKKLAQNDYETNAIVIVLTDGMDNMSSSSCQGEEVGQALKDAMKDEALESILSILVGVGVGTHSDVSQYLDTFRNDAGIDQYVEIADANAKTLAKLAAFISKSVSSQSQSLGSGGCSQTLQF